MFADINFQTISQQLLNWLMSSGLRIIIVIAVTFLLLRFASLISKKMFAILDKNKPDDEFKKRSQTLNSVLKYILNTVILVVSSLIIIKEIGIEIGPILAAAGVLGLAVGFGAQSIVKDVISGFFILLEDQIRVGDVVQVASKAGLVEKINLRLTTLRDLEGKVHYVPNGNIDVVTNMTKDYSCYVFDIGVAYKEDIDKVIDIIKNVAAGLTADTNYSKDILEPMEIFGVDKFADSAIIIKSRFKTKPIKQWTIAREFNRRLKKRFDEHDIEIPFPHLTLYLGRDKNIDYPAVNIAVSNKKAEQPLK